METQEKQNNLSDDEIGIILDALHAEKRKQESWKAPFPKNHLERSETTRLLIEKLTKLIP